ncbi:hypothetical protein EI94DRAFT_1715781 [Lactarius quietus]|nr:hypothetical protein EI94DRAFT_1715781 [Lactarius quietus]
MLERRVSLSTTARSRSSGVSNSCTVPSYAALRVRNRSRQLCKSLFALCECTSSPSPPRTPKGIPPAVDLSR